jgi:peptide-methionine (S)-S-oxide reductase
MAPNQLASLLQEQYGAALHLEEGMMRKVVISVSLAGALAAVAGAWALAAEPVVLAPAPALDGPLAKGRGTATVILSGGCFWGMQDVFQHVKGVTEAMSGYTGGAADTAHYEIVSTGTTRQAESLEITYDPSVITYGTLLRIFVSVAANPTELNYHGPDHGPQYRSMIWVENPEQRRIAVAYLRQLDAAHTFDAPIVTQVATAMPFYPAEAYHQNFATLHPDSPYIAMIDAPKITALAERFPTLYHATPTQVRVASYR